MCNIRQILRTLYLILKLDVPLDKYFLYCCFNVYWEVEFLYEFLCIRWNVSNIKPGTDYFQRNVQYKI